MDPVVQFELIDRPANLDGRKTWDMDKYVPKILETIQSKRVGKFVLRAKEAQKWRMSARSAVEQHAAETNTKVKLNSRKVDEDEVKGTLTFLLWAEEVKK